MSELLDKVTQNLNEFRHNTLVAGFFGAVVYVMFTNNLTRVQVFSSLLIGLITAYYLTPMFVFYSIKFFGLDPSKELEGGIGFILGLSALYIIPAIFRKINKVGS